jgi:hypothetical protein
MPNSQTPLVSQPSHHAYKTLFVPKNELSSIRQTSFPSSKKRQGKDFEALYRRQTYPRVSSVKLQLLRALFKTKKALGLSTTAHEYQRISPKSERQACLPASWLKVWFFRGFSKTSESLHERPPSPQRSQSHRLFLEHTKTHLYVRL